MLENYRIYLHNLRPRIICAPLSFFPSLEKKNFTRIFCAPCLAQENPLARAHKQARFGRRHGAWESSDTRCCAPIVPSFFSHFFPSPCLGAPPLRPSVTERRRGGTSRRPTRLHSPALPFPTHAHPSSRPFRWESELLERVPSSSFPFFCAVRTRTQHTQRQTRSRKH